MTVGILGIGLAFCASLFWTFAPLFFAAAGRRMGSFNVNVIRLGLAAFLLSIITLAYAAATGRIDSIFSVSHAGFSWLVLSGIFGLVMGDLFYLEALTIIGPRRTTQLFTLTPISSVFIAWMLLGERLSWPALCGIALIVGGIACATAGEQRGGLSSEPGRFSVKGMVFGAIAALFQAAAAVMTRQAFIAAPQTDPLFATMLRVGSAAAVMWMASFFLGRVKETFQRLKLPGAALSVTLGTLVGPVVGMTLYVSAFKYAPTGIVSTLSSLSPIFILPVIATRYKAKIAKPALIGTIAAVAGMAIISMGR